MEIGEVLDRAARLGLHRCGYVRHGGAGRGTLARGGGALGGEVDLDALGGVPCAEMVDALVQVEEVGADAGAGFEGGSATHGVLLVLVKG